MDKKQLNRKIEEATVAASNVADRLYNLHADDLELRLANLKNYRVELMRNFVLYTHLAIEDLLRELLVFQLRNEPRVVTVKELKMAVADLRSRDLVDWCARLGVLTKRQYTHLLELNRVRNKCSHVWIVDEPIHRRDKRGRRQRQPVVVFGGRDLFAGENFFDDFWPTYGRIFHHLLAMAWKIKGVA
jgi:hypothetical protein